VLFGRNPQESDWKPERPKPSFGALNRPLVEWNRRFSLFDGLGNTAHCSCLLSASFALNQRFSAIVFHCSLLIGGAALPPFACFRVFRGFLYASLSPITAFTALAGDYRLKSFDRQHLSPLGRDYRQKSSHYSLLIANCSFGVPPSRPAALGEIRWRPNCSLEGRL
jgi:hypothetical protein